MTSTSPVAAAAAAAVAVAVDSPQQNSFHPSWMRSTFNGGGNGASIAHDATKSLSDHSVAAPVFVKNRYGREDMLALMGGEAGHPAPEGLENCPFYVEEALQPLVCFPLSDLEQRLQQNINSSKAMASLSHAERANATTGSAYSSSTDSGSSAHKGNNGGWTSVKQWNRSHPTTGATRGNSFVRTFNSSGRNITRGDGGANIGQDHSQSNSFGPRFANRGRGGAVSARGGGVSGTAFNSRAQGLYDPRDPTDRPRNRMRSTSDEGDLIGEGGWTISPSGRHAWNNSSDTASSVSYAAEESSRKSESSTMPEWMEDGEDQDKGEFGDDTTSGTGSFDEHGRFQKKHHGHPVDIPEAKTSNVNRDLFVIERDIQHSTSIDDYNLVSSVERNAASQHMSGQCNSSSAQTHILNNEAETSRGGYSNVLCRAEAVGYHPSVPTQQTVSTASAIAPNTINQRTAQFFYIDPTKQERGPFEKMQMESWYKRGYFTDALEVRRHFETKYQTLGELIQLNGKLTPFDFKEEAPSQQPPVPPVFSNPSAQPFPALFPSGTGTVWSELGNSSAMIYNQTSYDPIAVERKRIEDEQRRILEEQAKMREYQEHIMREMQKQKQEQEKMLMEQKLALMKHQEEIERRERELKESAEETKARLEMERLALAEKARQLEEERVAKMQQCLEETRKAEEAEKRRLEEVERQRKLEEAAMREKEAERERCAKELAEEEARRLAAAKAEKIRQQQADQQRKQRITEDSARKTTPAASSNEKEKHRDSAKTFEVEEAWQSVSKSSQTASQKVINPTKVAPWSAASSLAPTKEKSLKEIQEEEERLLRAEQAKQARLRKEQESASLQSSGTWSNASQHLQWNQPAQQSSAIKTSTKPAWGGAGVEQHKASSSPLFDGPSLQAANKVPSALPKKTATASGKLNNKATPVNNSTNLLASEKAAKRALGMCEDNNVFIEWVVQRLKQLSSSVEADVLARFIEGVENPDEVEDYVMGYLGDSKTVKEFVREFLQKRSDFRNRGQHAVKDDLSSARGAPLSGNGSGFSVVQGRKKKNKGARLIVDGSCLGFRATSDPNRVNQGEIETVALSPGQKR